MDPIKTEIVVVGAGPGGYAAAFYAADLGKKVILIERDKRLGGVCLNRGCIPSKALLYATHQITAAKESEHRGITFTAPTLDLTKLRTWKEGILTKLSGGINQLAKMRNVTVIQGRAYFEGSQSLRVESEQGQQFINYETAICAVGSVPAMPKAFDLGNPRVMTSTEALEIEDIPGTLLVIGGGYIGMEMGTVYAALGSQVTVVELLDQLMPGADPDLVRPLQQRLAKRYAGIHLKVKVAKIEATKAGLGDLSQRNAVAVAMVAGSLLTAPAHHGHRAAAGLVHRPGPAAVRPRLRQWVLTRKDTHADDAGRRAVQSDRGTGGDQRPRCFQGAMLGRWQPKGQQKHRQKLGNAHHSVHTKPGMAAPCQAGRHGSNGLSFVLQVSLGRSLGPKSLELRLAKPFVFQPECSNLVAIHRVILRIYR